jgi:hypothetical protein
MTTHVKDSSVLGLPRRTCAPVTCAHVKKVLNSCKLVPIRVTQTSLKSQIQNQMVHPGTGWYTLWYTLEVQKTQCLSALVRVVHLEYPLDIPCLQPPPRRSAGCLASVGRQSIRTFPNLPEAIRTHPRLSEVQYFFFAFQPSPGGATNREAFSILGQQTGGGLGKSHDQG